jgi:serine/threonine-protein kinase RsbW
MPRIEAPNERTDLRAHLPSARGGGSLLEIDAWIPSELKAISPLVDRLMRLIEGTRCITGEEHAVHLALREALNNAVVHGNRLDARKLVHVRCRCMVGNGIWLMVSDQGQGFDVRTVPDSVFVRNLAAEHGRGIQLMKSAMDEVSFQRRGTEVHMCKRLARNPRAGLRSDSSGSQQAFMDAQERVGTWCSWGVVLLSWIGFFLVLALMFRATGCNHSSEAGTQTMDVIAESVSFEARSRNGPLQWVQQGSLSSQPVPWFGSKRRDHSVAKGLDLPPSSPVAQRVARRGQTRSL